MVHGHGDFVQVSRIEYLGHVGGNTHEIEEDDDAHGGATQCDDELRGGDIRDDPEGKDADPACPS